MQDAQALQSKKNLTLILYVLYIIAIFSGGILAIIALIINYVKRSDMQGTVYESHFNWQIGTFWKYLLWNIIAVLPFLGLIFLDQNSDAFSGLVLLATGFFLVVIFVAWIWLLYRHIRGLMALNENKVIA